MTTETYRSLTKSFSNLKQVTLFNLKFQARVQCLRGTVHKIHERLQNSQQNCEQGHATTAVNNDLCLWHADKFQ